METDISTTKENRRGDDTERLHLSFLLGKPTEDSSRCRHLLTKIFTSLKDCIFLFCCSSQVSCTQDHSGHMHTEQLYIISTIVDADGESVTVSKQKIIKILPVLKFACLLQLSTHLNFPRSFFFSVWSTGRNAKTRDMSPSPCAWMLARMIFMSSCIVLLLPFSLCRFMCTDG